MNASIWVTDRLCIGESPENQSFRAFCPEKCTPIERGKISRVVRHVSARNLLGISLLIFMRIVSEHIFCSLNINTLGCIIDDYEKLSLKFEFS